MTTARPVTAIVLAGGRSSRFGRDKLAEPIDGQPLLWRAIEAVSPFATEVLVVVTPTGTPDVPAGVRLVHDPLAFEGPLAGVHAGLAASSADLVLVTAGDMPDLAPAVIEILLETLDTPGIDAAVLRHDGRPRPLPMALRRGAATTAAVALIAAGERRLRALPGALECRVVEEATWRPLDPTGRTLHDIDTPADVVQVATPGTRKPPSEENGGRRVLEGERRG